MTIDQIEQSFGTIEKEQGAWLGVEINCPTCNCKIEIEIDFDQEGVLPELQVCENCLSEFKAGYIIEPEIILQNVSKNHYTQPKDDKYTISTIICIIAGIAGIGIILIYNYG